MLGETVGNYRVTAKLAEGGMGAVYRADHPLLGKSAAVKVLLPELSQNHEIVQRFFNEARAATAIRHPGIVEIFDFGYLASGMAYITMELLDGEPLSKLLVGRGRLTEQEALLYTRGLASALAAAHAQGIVHRDLKPDNIFIVRDPDMVGGLRPKILDFGIAKIAESQRVGGSSKTRTGAVLGTPTYMSPEQCRGTGDVDARSDLYSIGCILYEMLVGRPPFSSEGIGEVLGMHLYMPPTPPSELGVPISAAAEELIMKLLQKRPEDRLQSATDLARLLGQGSLPSIPSGPSSPTMSSSSGMRTPSPLLTPHGMLTPAPRNTGGALAASAPTTLSAAAGAGATSAGVEPPRRSRAGLFAVLGLAVAGAGIGAVVVLGGGGGKKADAPATGTGAAAAVVVDAGTPPAVVDAAAALVDAAPVVDAAELADAAEAPPDARKRNSNRGDKRNGSSSNGSGSGSSVDRGD